MRIVISSGHSEDVRGAVGPKPWGLEEVTEARRVVEHVADCLTTAGVEVETFHDDVSQTQDDNLECIVSFHNGQQRDLDISVHFNAFEVTTTQPRGCEVWYYSAKDLAAKVSAAIADAGDFIDRGAKQSDSLYFLNNTEATAILLEVCFVDSKPDCDLYRQNFDVICKAIAEAVEPEEAAEPPARWPRLPAAVSKSQQEVICKIANESWIASYAWKDRGFAPRGFTQGMALAFAQSYRKLLANHPAVMIMAQSRSDSDKDALNIYRKEFDALDLSNETSGADTLRHLYALMLGHGMRESSGRHCEGRDTSASNVASDTAEAGLFQTSYNAHSASDPEFDNLLDEYSDPENDPTCYLDAFEADVDCDSADWDCYGSGVGQEFQELCKTCPAFAVETAALTLRNLANHYGPIIRKETELRREADEMLARVQDYIDRIEAGTTA